MVEIVNGVVHEVKDWHITENTYMTIREFAEANGVSEALVRQWKHRGIVDGVDTEYGHFVRARTEIRLKKLKKKRSDRDW